MKRDLGRLTTTPYDLLVIGGGIYGACAAWEAARRGLSVALIEKGDFGQATSANSLKVIHGGLRYLQSFAFSRMRQSIRERSRLLRLAPHLVRAMPCVISLEGAGLRSAPAMAAALWLNECLSWDRNLGLTDPRHRIPAGRVIGGAEWRRLAPPFLQDRSRSGALWYDGYADNTERLTLSFVLSAVRDGADAANYAKATELLQQAGRVAGVRAVDGISGRMMEIRARLVLNAAGPWASGVLPQTLRRTPERPAAIKGINLVLRRALYTGDVAVGISPAAESRMSAGYYFITPWRGRSVIGTAYASFDGDPDRCAVTEEELLGFLSEIRAAAPELEVARDDVAFVHVGLLPAERAKAGGKAIPLQAHYRLTDHKAADGIEGLISVSGVKYTTARAVAAEAVELACAKLGKPAEARIAEALYGGALGDFESFVRETARQRPLGLELPAVRRLVSSYGAAYADPLRWAAEAPALKEELYRGAGVLRAEVVHAVREEMAATLADAVFRRTDLASAGHPGAAVLKSCVELMREELHWSAERAEREHGAVAAVFERQRWPIWCT